MRFVQNTRSRRLAAFFGIMVLLAAPLLASEARINLRTTLTGPVFNGELPKGKAEFQMESGVKRFIVEVEDIDLPNGTLVGVFVNGVRVGQISLFNHGGTLLRSTAARQTVPNISTGTAVTVKFSTTTILHGKF